MTPAAAPDGARTVVQIAACAEGQNTRAFIAALCDDGSIWTLAIGSDHDWYREPAIPQDARPHLTVGGA